MRIVDALKARNHLAPFHDASAGERQARRARPAAQHARGVMKMDEIPGELLASSAGGRVIEHVESRDGDFYRVFGGDPAFAGDDVTKYFVAQDGTPTMLERCTKPSSRAELEQMQARKEQRRLEREAAAKAATEQQKAAAWREVGLPGTRCPDGQAHADPRQNHGRPTTLTVPRQFVRSRANVEGRSPRSCSTTIRNLRSGSSGR